MLTGLPLGATDTGAQNAPVLLTGLSPLGTGDANGSNTPLLLAANSSADSIAPSGSSGGVSLGEVEVIAKQLNEARINIEPQIGASTYTLTPAAIQNLPGAQNTPIDNAILQMPGVDQDNLANGGLHIRNEHLNVQYRIDGVIIPDGVSFFGQDLSLRFVQFDDADHREFAGGVRSADRRHHRYPEQERSLQPGRLGRNVWRQLHHPQSEHGSRRRCRRLQLFRDRRAISKVPMASTTSRRNITRSTTLRSRATTLPISTKSSTRTTKLV